MTRSWWDNEDILRQFRDWLTRTSDEMESLEDESTPDGSCDDSRDSLQDPWNQPRACDQPAPELPDVGLLQLVEAFTAMRHELKLHTKGTRNLEASVGRSLEGLDTAARTFQSVQANEREAAERAAMPMVEALIGLDEGLLRAEKAFQATHRQMTHSAPSQLRDDLDKQFANQSWWRRLMTRRWHALTRETASQALSRTTSEEFASLMEGFKLIQSRLARTLNQLNIHRLDEPGGQVDPTRMTVVELIDDRDAPPETVIEVVRPGYSWGERIVRFAEVHAVASRSPQLDADSTQWDQEQSDEDERQEVLDWRGEVDEIKRVD